MAIVNQSFAKKLFGGKNPVGRTFRIEAMENEAERVYQIVGMVGDTRYRDISEPQQLIAFFPIDQDPKPASDVTFVIKGRESLDALQAAILRGDESREREFAGGFQSVKYAD